MSPYRDSPPCEAIAIAPDRRRRNGMLAFTAGALAALGGWEIVSAAQRASVPVYSVGVDQLMAAPPDVGRAMRIDGELVPGSVVREESPCEYRFAVEKNGFRIPVRYPSCIVSDPFAAAANEPDSTPVVLDGELQPSGFVASNVLAKVPSCCFCTPEQRVAQMRTWREHRRR